MGFHGMSLWRPGLRRRPVSASLLTWAVCGMQGGGPPIVNNNTPGGDISNSNCGGTISSNGGTQSTCG